MNQGGLEHYIWALILLVLVSLLGLRIWAILWWRPKRLEAHFEKQGIKGPSYKLFIGNVKELVQLMLKASSSPMSFSHNIVPRVFSFYHHWCKIYGGTFLVWFGPTARLVVSDPNLIREIFTSKSKLYEKIEANPLMKQLEGDGLLSLKGHKWAHHRKIISPTFHMENLKLLIPKVGKSVEKMVVEWETRMSEKGEAEIEVSEWYQVLTEEVISRVIFGSSYEEEGKAIFRLQSQQMLFAAEAFQKVLFPGYRFIPTKKNMKSWRLDKEIRRSLTRLITQRRSDVIMEEANNNNESGPRPKDLLGLMIRANDDPDDDDDLMTVNDIVEECKSFFFAGKQTTSNLLTWTTVLLAMHPHWQGLARDELFSVCGSRDLPSIDDISKLKLLSMIINESLRLYPPAIATIRRSKHDVNLGPYTVPRGTELLVPILAVHHDQSLWGTDVHDFNPLRFSDGISRAATHPAAFMPFGLGMRTCIGQNLAVLQAKLGLAALIRRFSFDLGKGYRHAPTVLMLLYPQYGAPIVFRRLDNDTNNNVDDAKLK